MRIGEAAERVGVTSKTIRFYESIGVLPEPSRSPSGYRIYDEDHLERLRFIKAAQRLGLKLDDIGEVLVFRDRGQPPCEYVVEVVRREVHDLAQRIREMRRLKSELEALLDQADEGRAVQDETCCPLISHECSQANTSRLGPLPSGRSRARER